MIERQGFLGSLLPFVLLLGPTSAIAQKRLPAPLTDLLGTGFGVSHAVLPDVDCDGYPEIAVGAPFQDGNVGAVQVFSGASQRVLYQWRGISGNDWFGYEVASVGDVDGDGIADIGIGAPQIRAYPFANGYVRVYSGATGSLLYQFAGDPASFDYWFGESLEGADLDGDGRSDVIVGIPWRSTRAPMGFHDCTCEGRVKIFSGRDGRLLAFIDGTRSGGVLGAEVHSPGDLNANGTADLVVGAPAQQTRPFVTGEVFLFEGSDRSLIERLEGSIPGDLYGWSLATLGDASGDSVPDLIIGAPGLDGQTTPYVQVLSGATRTELFPRIEDTAVDSLFGWSVDGGSDLNGDGVPDLVVGAPETFSASPKGRAASYSGANGNILLFDARGSIDLDYYGYDVSAGYDVDLDGVEDWIVTAPQAFPPDTPGLGYLEILTSPLVPDRLESRLVVHSSKIKRRGGRDKMALRGDINLLGLPFDENVELDVTFGGEPLVSVAPSLWDRRGEKFVARLGDFAITLDPRRGRFDYRHKNFPIPVAPGVHPFTLSQGTDVLGTFQVPSDGAFRLGRSGPDEGCSARRARIEGIGTSSSVLHLEGHLRGRTRLPLPTSRNAGFVLREVFSAQLTIGEWNTRDQRLFQTSGSSNGADVRVEIDAETGRFQMTATGMDLAAPPPCRTLFTWDVRIGEVRGRLRLQMRRDRRGNYLYP